MEKDEAKPGPSAGQDVEGAVGGAATDSGPTNLLDFLSMPENKDAHMVMPLTWCPHLETINSDTNVEKFDDKRPCKECGHVGENWICLVCREVYCSRYVNEHMVSHNNTSRHLMAISCGDLSVWCYACDYYVDNDALYSAKNALHRSKFGDDMPRRIDPIDIQHENV